MDTLLCLDWETYSELELRDVGLWRYSRSPSTHIWCGAYAFGDEEPQLWVPPAPCPPRVASHIKSGGLVVAHNFPFEIAINNNVAVRHGWPIMDPAQGACTMAMAYAMGLPGALEDVALALGLSMLKDTEGRAIMLRYAKPWKTEPTRWMDENPSFTQGGRVWTGAEGLERIHDYCAQDVRVEREVLSRMVPLSDKERQVWLADYEINQRGVAIDLETVKAARELAVDIKAALDVRMAEVTGGRVQTCTAVLALKGWMADMGVAKDSLAKQEVVDLIPILEASESPNAAQVVLALRLRQEAAKASAAKFNVMQEQAGDDGRLHNLYQYHGAATGRWAGRGVQIHNLPRSMPPPKQVEHVMQLTRAKDYKGIDLLYGPPLSQISSCLRALLVAPEGKLLVGGDWANIEGRGAAWFAGEQWKLDAFVAADEKRGPGLYELAYARMFGVPVESVLNPSWERQVGKVSELSFQYQGGGGSFHAMGKNYGVKVDDAQAEEFKLAWRASHTRIVQTWYEIQRAAISAVKHPGEKFTCGHPGRQATFMVAGSFLWCKLPSGRAICYPFPKILEGAYGPELTYMTQPSPEDLRKNKIIDDLANGSRWCRIGTYGGSLFNNIVQGFCSDVLRELLLWLRSYDAQVVVHTHDDAVIEVPHALAEGARAAMEARMNERPTWAPDFPLFARCNVMQRYGK